MNQPACCTIETPSRGPSFWERFRVWRRNFKHRKTARAVRHLQKVMKNDPEFWLTWQSNIACVTADSLRAEFFELTQQQAMESGNRCADRLMSHLFNAPRREAWHHRI